MEEGEETSNEWAITISNQECQYCVSKIYTKKKKKGEDTSIWDFQDNL